jgi:hypothetical protein
VPVLNPSFVIDCEEQGTFLNTSDYVILPEIETTHGKKRKSTSGSLSKPSKSTKGSPYTDEEREYFLEFVEKTLRSSPDTTNNALATLLSKKVEISFFAILTKLILFYRSQLIASAPGVGFADKTRTILRDYGRRSNQR